MRADSGLNRLVYEYFEARILYGYYKYGESLPSINKICQMFHLAQATVRAGLALLEKGGYVRVDPRTAPVVVYKGGTRRVPGKCSQIFRIQESRDSRLGSVRKAAV